MDILIIDGQGGNLGRQLTRRLKEALPGADITAVGTNSTATENMLKGGADRAATTAVGQSNAVRVLVPMNRCDTLVAGVEEKPMGELIEDAVGRIVALLQKAD